VINSISADEADPSILQLKKALSKKAEMDIIGYSYVQERSFDALQAAAGNEGSAGALMGAGMGLGMGVGVGSPMGNAMAAIAKEINPSNAKHCINCGVAVPPEARFCPGCGTKIG
jgi:membrane protease subunit (stomatin/prohibitin family)